MPSRWSGCKPNTVISRYTRPLATLDHPLEIGGFEISEIHSPHSTTRHTRPLFCISLKAGKISGFGVRFERKTIEFVVSDVQNPQNFHLRRCFAFTFRPNMYNFRLDKIWVILPCDYAYTSWFLRFQKSIRHTRPLATLDHLGSKFRLSLHSTGRV